MELSLEGKIALVTGGGRDTGREISRQLAADGAIVAVNYRQADISDYDQVKAMVARIIDDWGGIDILINNAGYVKIQRFVESGPADWKIQIDTCLYGAIHCCHAVAPHMIERNSGRIVSLVGDSSRIGEANISMAATSRGGTIALGKSLAKELGRSNITVNTVSLGLVQTSHSDAEFLAKNMDRIVRAYPLRRIGVPEDVAPMVAFLSSDAASWITGQVVSVNGGFSMV
jgi:NAD(P)-dependent dehydrogenase (short-subunit alcohol dehydrogenase family)